MGFRSAIAGVGFIGAVHAAAVRSAGVTVAGVLASSPERGAAAAQRLGAARSYADEAELLADADVDVVHVCTPNHLHAELAGAALDAGRHVVCEKPLATSIPDAARLVDAAHDRVAAVPFAYRYYPQSARPATG